MHIDTFLGLGIGLLRDPNRDQNARNLQKIADALDAPKRHEQKRQEMRRFLVERGLEADDEVLARLGL